LLRRQRPQNGRAAPGKGCPVSRWQASPPATEPGWPRGPGGSGRPRRLRDREPEIADGFHPHFLRRRQECHEEATRRFGTSAISGSKLPGTGYPPGEVRQIAQSCVSEILPHKPSPGAAPRRWAHPIRQGGLGTRPAGGAPIALFSLQWVVAVSRPWRDCGAEERRGRAGTRLAGAEQGRPVPGTHPKGWVQAPGVAEGTRGEGRQTYDTHD
jgi:hypothetical protein